MRYVVPVTSGFQASMKTAIFPLIALALTTVTWTAPMQAATVSIGTSDIGWWSTSSGHIADNPNYIVGKSFSVQFRNYFTFDLTGVTDTITSATLKLFTYVVSADLAYELYDVSTDPVTLDTTSAPNSTIFNDLGSGTSYGSFSVRVNQSHSDVLFTLNSAGVAAINAARGSFFSIGGDAPTAGPNDYIFGFGISATPSNALVLTSGLTEVPEPSPLPGLLGFGIFGGAIATIRHRGKLSLRALSPQIHGSRSD